MIKHIVLFEFAENISDEQIKLSMQKLKNLQDGPIPQIKSFNHGENCSVENLNQNFNYGFVMEFDNVEDRDYYVEHPTHIKIADEEIVPLMKNGFESVIVLDFEVN